MKNLSILPELTKKYILERVTQEEIMLYYNKVEVNDETLLGNSFTSRMRKDNNPTCNYYYYEDNKGEIRLKLRDWNGSFNGDIFDVASFYTKINSKTSQGFKLLLHKIAKDFKIHKYKDGTERDKLDIIVQEHIKRKELRVFNIIPRKWNEYDKRYWYDKFGITFELLKIGKVIPIDILQVEGKDGYLHNNYKYYSKDPAFAYYGGEINGIKLWRIYFPLRDKGRRFLSNYAFIQGLHLFEPARVCIITKSYKDVLCYKTFGITAVAVPSETYVMNKDEIFNIKSKCDIVVTNFDYDKTGILLANKYKRKYNISPLMFTRGKYNQYDYGVKDFSEYREKFGKQSTLALINLIIDEYREDLENINKYNYEALKWIV
jgi:hypothetical protein